MNENAERYCHLMRAARDLIVLARSASNHNHNLECRNLVKQSMILVAEAKALAKCWLADIAFPRSPLFSSDVASRPPRMTGDRVFHRSISIRSYFNHRDLPKSASSFWKSARWRSGLNPTSLASTALLR